MLRISNNPSEKCLDAIVWKVCIVGVSYFTGGMITKSKRMMNLFHRVHLKKKKTIQIFVNLRVTHGIHCVGFISILNMRGVIDWISS